MPNKEKKQVLYRQDVLVSHEHYKAATFDLLQYEVERFAQWYYERYAKVYMLKPQVGTISGPVGTGPVYKLRFEWIRWEV